MPNEQARTRVFRWQEQLAFAALSGDFNPIHVDHIAARRTLYGVPLVHGVHVLLWSIGVLDLAPSQWTSLRRIKAQFRRPVFLNEEVRVTPVRIRHGELKWRIEQQGAVVVTVVGETEQGRHQPMPMLSEGHHASTQPKELGAADLPSAFGSASLVLDADLAESLLGDTCKKLRPYQIAVHLASSRIIGMSCPGLHSLFAELDLEFALEAPTGKPELTYRVRDFDERFKRIDMKLVAPGVTGRIACFLRPAPKRQRAMNELQGVVPEEFASQRALVVGGSRGLGELCAKLLASGGASVMTTFASGREDAERVAQEIRSAGRDCVTRHLDVLDLKVDEIRGWGVNSLYYFASPRIAPGGKELFSQRLFARYCSFYVTAFAGLVEEITVDRCPLRVFVPSSIFVSDVPAGFAEYAAAKAAAEVVGRSLPLRFPGIVAHVARLPRLETDQTTSLVGEQAVDSLPVMLEQLRRLNLAT